MRLARFASIVLSASLIVCCARAASLEVPFDFARGAIGLDASVKGAPLFVLLDTGADPSLIDIRRARELGLQIDFAAGGEGSGVGDAPSAKVYPTTIDGLAIDGHPFARFDALAADTSAMSAAYGRRLDAVLGYSFLTDKIVLIDYAGRRIDISDQSGGAAPALRSCGARWTMPLRFLGGDNTPIIPAFRFGAASGPSTLDTGSNSGITFFPRALDLPGVRAALVEKGEVKHAGFRGDVTSKTYVLNQPVGFGPFTLPAGEIVKLGKPAGDDDKRVANIGNPLFAAMKLKILLDYRARQITFYGHCGG